MARKTTSSKPSPESAADAGIVVPKSAANPPMKSLRIMTSAIVTRGPNVRIDDQDIDGLAASMAQTGLVEPIGVFRPAGQGGFVLVFGHRRLAAARKLGWVEIDAVVFDDEKAAHEARAVENLQRLDLNPIESAIAVGELMDHAIAAVRTEYGLRDDQEPGGDVADAIRKQAIDRVAKRLGKTAAWVRDRVFLGTLDKVTRELVVAGKLPWEHARELAKIADEDKRAEIAKDAAIGAKEGWRGKREVPMLMSELRREVAKHIRNLAHVSWRLDLPFAEAPACNVCPSNSKNQTGLFEDGRYITHATKHSQQTAAVPDAGVCMHAACYGRKSGMASRQITTACKRVTLTVNAAPKAEREKQVPKAIAQHQPQVVAPKAWTRAAKEHRERFAAAAKNKPKAGTSSSAPAKRAKTAEEIAREKLRDATYTWEAETERLIDDALRSQPALFVFLNSLTSFDLKDKEVIPFLKQILEDPAAALSRMAKLKLAKHANIDWYQYSDISDEICSEARQVLSAHFGVNTKKPKPVLEDFLPKPAAAAGGKKPGKSAKKKTGAKKPGKDGDLGYCHECMDLKATHEKDGEPLCDACDPEKED